MRFPLSSMRSLLLGLAVFTAVSSNSVVLAATYEVVAEPAFITSVTTGFTRARTEQDLISEVGARCLEVKAEIGDTIDSDGVFARLDSTFIKLALERNLIEQEKQQSLIDYLLKEANRYRVLVQRETAAQSALDRLEQDLDQARITLESLRVEARTLEEQLERHTILAPAGWKVVDRTVEAGEWVTAGSVLGTVGDYRTLIVPVVLSPQEFGWAREQKSLPLILPDHQSIQVPSRILRVSPAFDPATRKINVELIITAHMPERRGGVRCELRIPLPDPSGAVILPGEALEKRYEELWITRANREQVRVVLLETLPDGDVRVSSPRIKAGDRFLVNTEDQK